MKPPRKGVLWFWGLGVLFVACAPKEYAQYSPAQPNWLKADPRAADLATEAKDPPIQSRTFFVAGQLFEQQGDFAKGVVQYRKAIAADPNYVPAYNRLGVLLGRLGQHAEAEKVLKAAVQLRPDWAFLRNNLGFEFMLQERWADAEAELRNAVSLKPDFARAHNNLAMVLFKTGRVEEALAEFREAVPEADAYYNLGLLLRGEQRYRDAANAFEHVLSLAPHFDAAKMQLAQLAPRLELEPTPMPSPASEPEVALVRAEFLSGPPEENPSAAPPEATAPPVQAVVAPRLSAVHDPESEPLEVHAGPAEDPAAAADPIPSYEADLSEPCAAEPEDAASTAAVLPPGEAEPCAEEPEQAVLGQPDWDEPPLPLFLAPEIAATFGKREEPCFGDDMMTLWDFTPIPEEPRPRLP